MTVVCEGIGVRWARKAPPAWVEETKQQAGLGLGCVRRQRQQDTAPTPTTPHSSSGPDAGNQQVMRYCRADWQKVEGVQKERGSGRDATVKRDSVQTTS